MKEKIKTFLNDHNLELILFLVIALQPVIDLDYLIYDALNSVGLPRPATIIRFLIIPVLIIGTFIKKEKNKKKVFLFTLLYGVLLGTYFVWHCYKARYFYLNNTLYLTNNFEFSLKYEIFYTYTLVVPYFVIYMVYNTNWKEEALKRITVITSATISLPILISDLFLFGKSTYQNYTRVTILQWFNPNTYKEILPREVACKFFFAEGNTTGIVLAMILPLLYYFFYKAEKKEKIMLAELIVIQSLSMLILSTRISTYMAALVPAVVLVTYLFLVILKKEKLCKVFILTSLVVAIGSAAIIPYSPAYQNQRLNTINNKSILEDDALREEGRNSGDKTLVPGTAAYNFECIYRFQQYGLKAHLIATLPEDYYMIYYYYKYDAGFWCDILFEYPFEVQANGRKFEETFMKYKWKNLTPLEKISAGMGYSTFMFGSILLESDFRQQIFTYGYAGFVLTVLPWLLIFAYSGLYTLFHFKKCWNMKMFMLLMAMGIGFASAYMSGHTLDQFMTTMILATISGFIFKEIKEPQVKS